MIDKESQKLLLNSVEVMQQEKLKQLEMHTNYKNYKKTLNEEIQNVEKQIGDFFDERTEKVSELNDQLRLAIEQNDKESILKITAKLGGITK